MGSVSIGCARPTRLVSNNISKGLPPFRVVVRLNSDGPSLTGMHFRYAWLILFLFGLIGVGASLPYIFLGLTVEPKGTMAVQQVSKISPDLGNTVTAMIRVLGLAYLVWGALVAAISVTAFRRGEVWAWYALWTSAIFWVGDIIINLSIGGTAWIFDAVALTLGVATLLVSPQFDAILGHRSRISP